MELADLVFAVRRFWLLALAVPATAFALAVLAAYLPAERYTASSTLVFQPASADVDLRVVQFLLPSVPLEVGTAGFQDATRESLPDDLARASWTLTATADTGSGVITLTAGGLNPEALPAVANAAADELVERRDTSQVDIDVLDTAEASVSSAPRRAPILFGAAVLGAIGGLFAAALAAYLRPRFRRPEDVADRFGLRLLGEVPLVRASRLAPARSDWESSGVLEFFKRLRMNVEAGLPPDAALAVVSYGDGDGKSTITANFACAPTALGRTVAIVDGDLERPSLDRYLGGPRVAPTTEPGFHANGFAPPAQVGSRRDRTVTLVAPAVAPSPGGDTLARALPEVLRGLGDTTVIVDTPALSRSADGVVAARIAGHVMLVVDIRRQSPQEVEESVRVLREAAVDIVGVVVNRTSRDVPRVQTRRAQPSRRAETDAPAPISSAPGQARESGVSAGAEGDAPTSPAIEGSSGGA